MTGFLDNHPASERDLRKGQRLDSDHVIVDRDDWEQARTLQDTVGRLQAIVDKLPKTKNGAPVVPGMTVYHRPRLNIIIKQTVFACTANALYLGEEHDDDGECYIEAVECYNTREAAEAEGGE